MPLLGPLHWSEFTPGERYPGKSAGIGPNSHQVSINDRFTPEMVEMKAISVCDLG
jgi:hypothetical protein